MVDRFDHRAVQQLGIAQHLTDVSHRPRGNPGPGQRGDPVAARSPTEGSSQRQQQLGVVPDAAGVGGEARIACERIQARDLAEPRKLRVVADGQDELAVRGVERVVRSDRGVAVSHAALWFASREIDGRLVRQQRSGGIQHRHVHLLAAPGPATSDERQQDALHREHAGDEVGHGDSEAVGGPVSRARDAHQTGLAWTTAS